MDKRKDNKNYRRYVMSNLTKENAAKVFGKGETKKLFSAGGVEILSNKYLSNANPRDNWLVHNVVRSGGKHLSQGMLKEHDHEKSYQAVQAAEAQYAALQNANIAER